MAEERKYTSFEELNQVFLMGRLTRDPEVRYTQGADSFAIARYTLAVSKRSTKEGGDANFISVVAFRDQAVFAEKYLRKGTKILVQGSIETGSYTNKEGQKVYTTEVNATKQTFCESKSSASSLVATQNATQATDGFMNIPDGIEEELPFN